ncbi:flagellar assembly peptidoglycan hydrolase FlgJ [Nitrosovibrio tenuis]|uniref:Peptidoglycan hydrolase FlgJ n=1 Tax=Nitrosovibrio tenuis TaxID=1233 RepID=A0A1H7J6A8_9PROT|nr:flagellar assembly peptidoglycan hydrolase FlgJ [Nitrosovibrio tenuis]SEK70146.1 flagellar protein FlgJ [Nitrosovibrio tenuis]
MAAPADISGKFALDVQAVSELRVAARKTGQAGLEAAARQFEALFLNMMLKSMREATPKDSLMDSEQTRLYVSMLDQQLSQSMAARGAGLAEIMMRQLQHSLPPDTAPQTDAPVPSQLRTEEVRNMGALPPAARQADALHPVVQQGAQAQEQPPPSGQAQQAGATAFQPGQQSQIQQSPTMEFQARLMAHAHEASQTTGIPARFMLGQAALESGWGKRELRAADGTPSHNLFGIKAGANWSGPVVEAATTEYVNGVARKTVEKFRAYSSYADAFRDYANFLRSNPRYAGVLAQAAQGIDAEGFAHGLQRAGYATDPNYADKLSRIIKRAQLS